MPTLTPSVSGSGGTVSPSSPQTVALGGSQAFTFAPDDDYRVQYVYVDGVRVETADSYTFTNVQASHSLSVTFTHIDWINAIADALVDVLKTINGTTGGYTLDLSGENALVSRMPSELDWPTLPRPWGGVRFVGITDQVQYGGGANNQWRASGDFEIGLGLDASGLDVERDTPERAGAVAAQDVMRAIANDVTLAPLLARGIAQPGAVKVSQAANTGGLVVYVSVVVNATWVWRA